MTEEANNGTAATLGSVDGLIQRGARQIIQQAIEAELATLLEPYENVKTPGDNRAVVRNGYLPAREIVTAIGTVPVEAPKVRGRPASGSTFNSNIVLPYIRLITGFPPEGQKQRVAIADGYRESKDSWVDVLLELK